MIRPRDGTCPRSSDHSAYQMSHHGPPVWAVAVTQVPRSFDVKPLNGSPRPSSARRCVYGSGGQCSSHCDLAESARDLRLGSLWGARPRGLEPLASVLGGSQEPWLCI